MTVVRRSAVPLSPRAWTLLAGSSAIGLFAFVWPLFSPPAATNAAQLAHTGDAPVLFAVVLPLLFGLLFAELADGSLDAKAVAVLGVLVACGSALRLPTGGVTGFSPVFFLLIPAGRVFGAGFGFVLGCLTLFASALISGGVGPWLPFQMFGAGWVGLIAGLLPPVRGRAEILLLAAYGAVAGLAYGLLLNLWFWPYGVPLRSGLSFVPGAAVVDNLGRFWAFHLTTSLGFDIPRAAGNVVLVVVLGPATLAVLRRTARRAAFGAVAEYRAPAAEQPA
ncbi:MAG: energy-coupling factor transport system substrate-specific component [Actinomycetota bacterium]|jgi:energy-coupling factor transport system substrate-specific component